MGTDLPVNVEEGDPDTDLREEDDEGGEGDGLRGVPAKVPDVEDVAEEEHHTVE